MIEDAFVLGKIRCKLEGEPEFLEKPNTNYALIIGLERKENKLNFQGIKIEKVKEDWKKYMYRRGPTNKYDFTPSSILQQRKINFSYILHKFNLFLRDAFKKKENLTRDTLQTLSIYIFLNKLSLLSGEKMENKNNSLKNNNILDYSIFSNNERKHAFLVGALANYILFIQRSERGNEPFRSKLNNLIIDQNRLRKIFVECVEKLNQYGKSIPSWLPKNFDKILNTPEKWKSSTDEISYFFTLAPFSFIIP